MDGRHQYVLSLVSVVGAFPTTFHLEPLTAHLHQFMLTSSPEASWRTLFVVFCLKLFQKIVLDWFEDLK